jgi:hypothetical protein
MKGEVKEKREHRKTKRQNMVITIRKRTEMKQA